MKMKEKAIALQRKTVGNWSLRLRLTALVTVELLFSVLLVAFIAFIVNSVLPIPINVPMIATLSLICLVVAALVTLFMARWFFNPVKKLSKAMDEVAKGNFKVQLDPETASKEISEIYSKFNLMVKELDAIEILQSDFVSNVSHEFKTPISAIEGYATLLQDCDNLNEDQKLYVEKINYNTNRLSNLTANILLLSKIENQHIPKNQTVFRLDEQIRQSIVMLENAWEKKEIELDVDMDSVEYEGSEALLYHVWDNLIGNAIKFSPQGGKIEIRLKEMGNKILFDISDEGPGFSKEAKKHIFDKFYQQDSSHKEEGNGLGLALVKRILVLENGEISASSGEEGGCTFKVQLQKQENINNS